METVGYSGLPDVYLVPATKETTGTLTKMTVSQRNVNKINKTILLVGETGAGKSTLINALVNYTMGGKFEENIWFGIVEDENTSQLNSQTSDVIVYEIFGFEGKILPYSLTIIDTPGFNSTGGIEQDVIISQRLFDLFRSKDGVHEINAVGLVMKASDNRLSDRLKYVFNSVVSLFGKDLEDKIIALITHSDGRNPENTVRAMKAAKICVKSEGEPVHFLFNNCHYTRKTEENECVSDKSPHMTKMAMDQLREFLEKSGPQKLMTAVEVLNKCIRQAACILNLQERITFTELKQNEIKQTQDAWNKHEKEMENNEMFTLEVDEVYKDQENIDGGKWWLQFFKEAVCCKVCKETCHYPGCTMAQSPKDSEVMKNGCCSVCTGKCPVSDHVKENWRFVNKTRKVQKTKKEIQEKYEKSESETFVTFSETLEKEMKNLTVVKNRWLEESYRRVVKLKQIALNVDSLSTYVHFDFLIERMKEKGDREKVQKLEEMRSQEDDETRAVLLHKICDNSSKYSKIISQSTLSFSRSPAVYQLAPKKEKFGTLTRMIVGEKNQSKENKTILLVGETGTGKSTLINALVNYTMGVKFEDDIWFQIVEDEKRSQSESQTSDVIVYQIFGFEGQTLPYSLTIIDSPGYGSTEGIEHDEIVSQRFLDLFRSVDGVHEINAVGLVLKATEKRLTDRLRYIFDSVMSLFGKDLETNIVALITHSDGRKPKNALEALEDANIKCSKNEKNQPVYFLFDNCQHEDRTEDAEQLEHSYNTTRKGMKAFTAFLEKAEPQKLEKTMNVLNERVRLTACVQNMEERINLIELKQTEIKQTTEALKKHEQVMKMNEEFTVEIDEVYKDKETIDAGMRWMLFYKGAICCTVCEENCHYPGCTMAWYPGHCEVMKNGRCTSCTNKCPVSDHVKENWRYVIKTVKVKMTQKEMKEKYDKNKSECEKKLSLLENLEKEMKNLTTQKNQLLEESYLHIVRLEEISLNVDSLSTYVHLDFLIEKMKEKTDKVKKLKEMKIREDGRIRAGLRYIGGKRKQK